MRQKTNPQTDLIVEQLGGLHKGMMFISGARNIAYSNNQIATYPSSVKTVRSKPKYIDAQVYVYWIVNAQQNRNSTTAMLVALEPDASLSVYLYQPNNSNAITILGEEHDIPATGNAVIPVCERLLAANQLAFQGGLAPLD